MYNILFCFVPPQALYALFLKLFHKKIFRKQSSAFSFWKRAWGLLAVTNLDELTKLPKVCQLGVFVLDWIDPDFVSSFRYLQVDDHRCKAWIKHSHTMRITHVDTNIHRCRFFIVEGKHGTPVQLLWTQSLENFLNLSNSGSWKSFYFISTSLVYWK